MREVGGCQLVMGRFDFGGYWTVLRLGVHGKGANIVYSLKKQLSQIWANYENIMSTPCSTSDGVFNSRYAELATLNAGMSIQFAEYPDQSGQRVRQISCWLYWLDCYKLCCLSQCCTRYNPCCCLLLEAL